MIVFYTHFEMCSLAFLLLLIYYFFRSHRVNSPSMYIYAFYLLLTFSVMFLDILSVIFLTSEVVNTLFLGLQVFMAPIYMLYVLCLLNKTTAKNRLPIVLGFLPAVAMCALILTSHWTNLIFWIEGERYYHGPLHFVMYVVAGLYMLATLGLAVYWRKEMDREKRNAIYAISTLLGAMMVTQLVLQNYLLVGTGVVLGQYVMYNTFQNPMVYTDAPTGLLNRHALVTRLKRQRALGRAVSLGVVSMRGFKSVNDMFGIAVGDQLLKAVAVFLSSVNGTAHTYRFLGDVFLLAFANDEQMRERMAAVEARFADTWRVNDMLVRLSAGLCLIGTERCDAEADELVKLAEFSVGAAKARRAEGLVNVDERASEAMRRNLAIEQGLMNAIQRGEMEMHYQPLYETATGDFPTFEALARLRLDGMGYIPPDEFIRLAERSGLIVRLGEVILESVCRFLRDEKPERYGAKLAQINLSVVQCMDAGFAKRSAEILRKYGVDPNTICFEITETMSSYSDATLLDNMRALCELGVCFALDDYGTGYSTADYAMRMPFSHIKLDKNFVVQMTGNERERLLLSSFAEMFGKLGFHVVAEGVETQLEAGLLMGMGVDYLQGYLYSKPLPQKEYLDFMKRKALPTVL